MKKTIIVLMCILLALASFAACGKTEEQESVKQETKATEQKEEKTQETATEEPQEPLEFSVMYANNAKFPDDVSETEKAAQEMYGCTIEFIKVPSSSYTEKLSTVLASGDLPDLVYNVPVDEWAEQGAIIELDQFIDAGLALNIAECYTDEDWLNVKSFVDGKTYHISGVTQLKEVNTVAIRTDWLELLELDTPSTVDEWIDVLKAFRDNDPAGDGSTIAWAGLLDPWFDAYGIARDGIGSFIGKDLDSDLYVSVPEADGYREALENLAYLYSEGLIDQEFVVRNKDAAAYRELFYTGVAGAGVHAANRAQLITESIMETNADARFVGVTPIVGPNGDQQIQGRGRYWPTAVITVSAEEEGIAEEIFKYIDWNFSKQGRTLWNFGVEGVHHEIVDGMPRLLPPYNDGWTDKRLAGMDCNMRASCWDSEAYKQSLFVGKTVDELDEIGMITYNGLFDNSPYIYRPLMIYDVDAKREYYSGIQSMLSELQAKAITGQITIDEFYEAYESVKEDMDKIIDEENVAYDKVKNG